MKEGDKYGRLTAVKLSHKEGNVVYWIFLCDCGNEVEKRRGNVKSGHTQSCGCLRSEKSKETFSNLMKTHGHWSEGKASPTWLSWSAMKQRCYCKSAGNYYNYGGRGITVCDRWLGKDGFKNFLEDMGERVPGESLDRIDVNGNYEPSNCRWLDSEGQSLNKRSTIVGIVDDERITLKEACDRYILNRDAVYRRIYRQGDSLEEAIEYVSKKTYCLR